MTVESHWLEGGAILIVTRQSPLDAIARDAYRLGSERPISIAGISFDVVGVKTLPVDPRCTRIRLQRYQGAAVAVDAPDKMLAAESAEMSNHDFRNAMSMLGFSLEQMARVLGIGRRRVAHYRKDLPLPPHISLAVRHLLASRIEGRA